MSKKKESIHKCAVCGKTFTAYSNRALYCSEKCHSSVKYHKKHGGGEAIMIRRQAEEANRSSLAAVNEIIKEAERHGLSWGKYMALKDRGAIWG